MLKLKMMLCVMMLPLVVVGCTSPVCQSVREATTASGVDNATSPPTGRHRQTDGIPLREERPESLCKNNWKEPRSILMSSADGCPYRWATHAIIVSNTHALPAEYKPLKSNQKPSNPFTNVCWVSVLTTFSAPPQILAASTVSSLPNSRNEEMMGDGFLWCYCCRFVLNSKRLLAILLNKQGQRSSRE